MLSTPDRRAPEEYLQATLKKGMVSALIFGWRTTWKKNLRLLTFHLNTGARSDPHIARIGSTKIFEIKLKWWDCFHANFMSCIDPALLIEISKNWQTGEYYFDGKSLNC